MNDPGLAIVRARLGPVRCGTVVTADADAGIAAYRAALDLVVVSDAPLSAAVATAWGMAGLAGRRLVVLAADSADPATHWLRLLEVPGTEAPAPMSRRGWLALEVLVRDVHALAQRLASSRAFRILGAPRPLSTTDAIWAMQVAGPAGETLYLTEVRAAVPPFHLPPPARHTAERLFIPVLSAPGREAALAWYESLNGNRGLRFEARASALNRCLGADAERHRPMAALQLAGGSLIEIDEVPEHAAVADPVADPAALPALPAGLAMVSLFAPHPLPLPVGAGWHRIEDERWTSGRIALLRGPAGEWIELMAESRH